MKTKSIVFFSMIILSINTFSQTYELVSVFEDKSNHTYLSYWDEIENLTDSTSHIFSLWGYQRYDESWIIGYEVEYFKADAINMLLFLEAVADFSDKYKNKDKIVTYISGVKIKTVKQGAIKYTIVFDSENKVCCFFRQNSGVVFVINL
ncbi:MAG: hypothetical protein LUH15_09215 [Tannerellaceae bacterium]|nr:hypothetical protein [Tannerellaceae bacterium]